MTLHLGEGIRRRRREAGLTQEQLAEALGVTTGAVHKWESGKAAPELEKLVELAAFFEVSVDALLDYGWEKLTVEKAVERLRQYARDKEPEAGLAYAEKALTRFPNSFGVVYRSANLYFLTLRKEHMPRALELYEKALTLLEQNTDEEIGEQSLQTARAYCLCYMDRMEEGIELLKRRNVEGVNNYRIGLLLSQLPGREQEALPYLSQALGGCYSTLYNICIGYANAYGAMGRVDQLSDLILWLYELGEGLREPGTVNWMDRGNTKLFLILAEMDRLRGNEDGARAWLCKARDAARRFDAAPNYNPNAGMRFFHGRQDATSYDDMGSTAMDVIENFLADDEAGKKLRPLWDGVKEEKR